MIDSGIIPYTCSTSFGMPSGHSSASQVISIVIFLDIFHGKTSPYYKQIYGPWYVYVFCLILALFWSFTIPFSRFLLGSHSLDQVIYGFTNGVCEGLILHFLIRDHLISHIENVLAM